MSLVCTIYAMVLFGKKPLKKMMKYNSRQNSTERKKALWNMTWDLYMMNQFFKRWIGKDESDEFIFASDDKAFCELLRSAIKVQQRNDFSALIPFLTNSGYEQAKNFLNLDMSNVDRVYTSDDWSPEYRNGMIGLYEEKLIYSEKKT